MYGLYIHVQSIHLNQDVIGSNDKIRVSITTVPEENKQAFVIEAKKMDNIHHFFTVNITDQTKKIIIVFRKKSFILNDPIIASTILHSDQFPNFQDKSKNTEIKLIDIYDPLQHSHQEKSIYSNNQRRNLGRMEIQLSLEEAFPVNNNQNSQQRNPIRNSKRKGNSKTSADTNQNENIYQNQNDMFFVDNGVYN
ncbi:hypothetical protein M9Y10_031906 [Tritrichomonas musculus]|uniref:Uncharacterized protein n=1 Tax=Tritrichomonas musculus TaxID=1915356 RepID=A0ABR2H179_9EUKA